MIHKLTMVMERRNLIEEVLGLNLKNLVADQDQGHRKEGRQDNDIQDLDQRIVNTMMDLVKRDNRRRLMNILREEIEVISEGKNFHKTTTTVKTSIRIVNTDKVAMEIVDVVTSTMMEAEGTKIGLSTHHSTSICLRRRNLKTGSRQASNLTRTSSMKLMMIMFKFTRKNKNASSIRNTRLILGLSSDTTHKNASNGNTPSSN